MINGSGSFWSWFGSEAAQELFKAWRGTNTGFDQSVNSATNNDSPMPIVTAGAAATQDLTVALFDDSTDTFFGPTINLIITAGLYTDSDTFHAPTLTPGAVTLTVGLFADGDTFFGPTATPGAVTITAPLFTDGDIFFDHTISVVSPQDLVVGLFTDGDTVFSHTVTPGAVTIEAPLLDEGNTFFEPEVEAAAVKTWWDNSDWVGDEEYVKWVIKRYNEQRNQTVEKLITDALESARIEVESEPEPVQLSLPEPFDLAALQEFKDAAAAHRAALEDEEDVEMLLMQLV